MLKKIFHQLTGQQCGSAYTAASTDSIIAACLRSQQQFIRVECAAVGEGATWTQYCQLLVALGSVKHHHRHQPHHRSSRFLRDMDGASPPMAFSVACLHQLVHGNGVPLESESGQLLWRVMTWLSPWLLRIDPLLQMTLRVQEERGSQAQSGALALPWHCPSVLHAPLLSLQPWVSSAVLIEAAREAAEEPFCYTPSASDQDNRGLFLNDSKAAIPFHDLRYAAGVPTTLVPVAISFMQLLVPATFIQSSQLTPQAYSESLHQFVASHAKDGDAVAALAASFRDHFPSREKLFSAAVLYGCLQLRVGDGAQVPSQPLQFTDDEWVRLHPAVLPQAPHERRGRGCPLPHREEAMAVADPEPTFRLTAIDPEVKPKYIPTSAGSDSDLPVPRLWRTFKREDHCDREEPQAATPSDDRPAQAFPADKAPPASEDDEFLALMTSGTSPSPSFRHMRTPEKRTSVGYGKAAAGMAAKLSSSNAKSSLSA